MRPKLPREMHPCKHLLLLDIFHLAVVCIGASKTWIAEQVLGAPKTLPHLWAYTIRLLGQRPKKPFRFLDLPPEIRNVIYEHHFTLYRTPCYTQSLHERAVLPDAILNVNRQVYEEASHVLYSRIVYAVDVKGDTNLAGTLRNVSHVLEHVRTVHLKIWWPWCCVNCRWSWEQERRAAYVGFKENLTAVCGALAPLTNLRTVKISFHDGGCECFKIIFHDGGCTCFPSRHCMARHRIPDLLGPLGVVRRANPRVVVEMPEDCPVSSAVFAKQLEDGPGYAEGFEMVSATDGRYEEILGTCGVERVR